MIDLVLQNIGILISAILLLSIVIMSSIEFRKSKDGYLTKTHLDHHKNIIFSGGVAIVMFMYGIYGITLTPIDYTIRNEDIGKAMIVIDGVVHLKREYLRSNEWMTLLRGLSSQYFVLLSISMFIFFYSAISHLRDERKGKYTNLK